MNKMDNNSAEELRHRVMALARGREYWLGHEAPSMKKNIRKLTMPQANSDMTTSNLKALDKRAIKMLAWKLAGIRMEFVELLTDCDACSLEAV